MAVTRIVGRTADGKLRLGWRRKAYGSNVGSSRAAVGDMVLVRKAHQGLEVRLACGDTEHWPEVDDAPEADAAPEAVDRYRIAALVHGLAESTRTEAFHRLRELCVVWPELGSVLSDRTLDEMRRRTTP